VLTVLVVCDDWLYVCEELCLFQHAVEGALSQRAREANRSKNKKLQRLLRQWQNTARDDDKRAAALRQAMGQAAAQSPPPPSQTASSGRSKSKSKKSDGDAAVDDGGGCSSVRRYRVLAVEPLQQLAQVDQTSTLSPAQAFMGAQHAGSVATEERRGEGTAGGRERGERRAVEEDAALHCAALRRAALHACLTIGVVSCASPLLFSLRPVLVLQPFFCSRELHLRPPRLGLPARR
jgi:hypothetical protein